MKYISISQFPGKMGETIFNSAFKKMKIDATYKAIKKLRLVNLRKFLIKNNINGSAISMPFKEKVIKYCDYLDKSVRLTNSCNTIILKREKIIGFNTDYLGIKKLIISKKIPRNFEFYIFGSGGFSRSFYKALNNLNYPKIYVIGRTIKRFNSWPRNIGINKLKRFPNNPSDNVIINATPIGMKQIKKKDFLSKLNLKKTKYYFECVVSPKNTKNIIIARGKSIKTVYGYEISIEQALIQFELYMKKKLSKFFVKKILKEKIIK